MLRNLCFMYQAYAGLSQTKREGEPDPTPIRSEQLDNGCEEVPKIQREFNKNSQEADRAAARQGELNSNFGVYLAVYFTAKKCSDNGFIFNQEIVDNIAAIVKEKGKVVPQALKDKGWQVLQNHYNSIVVSEQDCSQAMNQAQYMLPQNVFTRRDAPKNPF